MAVTWKNRKMLMDKRMAEEARLLMLPAEQKLSNDWGERDHEEVTQAGAA